MNDDGLTGFCQLEVTAIRPVTGSTAKDAQFQGHHGQVERLAGSEVDDLPGTSDDVRKARRCRRRVIEDPLHITDGLEREGGVDVGVRFHVAPESRRERVTVCRCKQRHQCGGCGRVLGRAADPQPGLVAERLAVPLDER